MKIKDLMLCYVDVDRAYFSSNQPEDETGDDWDDAPYEHNAGVPYGDGSTVVMVMFIANFERPCDGVINSRFSVDDINRKHIAWLRPVNYGRCLDDGPSPPPIFAGTALEEFITIIEASGGTVYVPRRFDLDEDVNT